MNKHEYRNLTLTDDPLRVRFNLHAVRRTIRRDVVFLFAVAVMLGIGLALALPVHGAQLAQAEKGQITGVVTVAGQGAAGITVELRQRSNAGADTLLASTATDATGTYRFTGQPSAPSDAFYYIKVAGGKGTLASWYTFPIIYVEGSDFTVPTIEIGDIEIIEPAQGATLDLPATLRWKARRAGETYRVFVYAQGTPDKIALDSGSLGTSAEFTIPLAGLPEGKYEAIVQVRDAVAGYGQSQTRFHFSVSKATAQPAANEPQPEQEQAQPQQAEGPQPQTGDDATGNQPPAAPSTSNSSPQQTEGAEAPDNAAQPALAVKLSANKTTVHKGDSIVYTIEVTNSGGAGAEGVVVTDRLPEGVLVDATAIKSTLGSVSAEGNTVTINVGNLQPGAKAVIEIPARVSEAVAANNPLNNQASAIYQGVNDPVQSNAYIAQVAEPVVGEPPAAGKEPSPVLPPDAQSQSQQMQQAERSTDQQAPPDSRQSLPAPEQKAEAPKPGNEAASPRQQPTPSASVIPETGGAFPVVFATILVVLTLLARYLRGRTPRRF
jgi:uncharacterized repeat protein (TIGR01451 family)